MDFFGRGRSFLQHRQCHGRPSHLRSHRKTAQTVLTIAVYYRSSGEVSKFITLKGGKPKIDPKAMDKDKHDDEFHGLWRSLQKEKAFHIIHHDGD
ncbi:MAG: hypothetical protein OXE77_07410 [Flavobacteriaceae bacterium]|nr:hypothetical protein [Flavobacteriaceae bacterium]